MPSIISLSDISSRGNYDKLKKYFHCENQQLQDHIKKHTYADQRRGLFHASFALDTRELRLQLINYINVEKTILCDMIKIISKQIDRHV